MFPHLLAPAGADFAKQDHQCLGCTYMHCIRLPLDALLTIACTYNSLALALWRACTFWSRDFSVPGIASLQATFYDWGWPAHGPQQSWGMICACTRAVQGQLLFRLATSNFKQHGMS